jgi:hypothetical protein
MAVNPLAVWIFCSMSFIPRIRLSRRISGLEVSNDALKKARYGKRGLLRLRSYVGDPWVASHISAIAGIHYIDSVLHVCIRSASIIDCYTAFVAIDVKAEVISTGAAKNDIDDFETSGPFKADVNLRWALSGFVFNIAIVFIASGIRILVSGVDVEGDLIIAVWHDGAPF